MNGPECLTDLDPSAGLEPENEWMVGLEGASQPSSTVPLLPRRRGHTDCPLPSIRSIPERSVSQVTLGPGAWHLASRVGHRRRGVGQSRGRSAQILTPPEQRVAHVGKLLSLIPISIPISHVEWSRQRGTLPQKT